MEQIDSQTRIAAPPTVDRRTYLKRVALAAVRAAGIGALSGFMGGIVWGIGARIVMRIVALAAHQPTEFSGGGTLMILMVGAFCGMPVGLIFAALRRRVRGSAPRQGIALGSLVLLLFGPLIYQGFRGEATDLEVVSLAIGLFGALFFVLGLATALVYRPLDHRLLNGSQNHSAAIGGSILLALPFVYEIVVIAILALGVFE